MAALRFDPTSSLEFDLGRGQIKVAGAGERVVVPVDALLDLCKHAGDDAARDFGRRLGTEAARRAFSRLQNGPASIEDVVEHLGGDLALMGLGSLGVERWGRALVVTFDHSPLGALGDALLGSVIEGALQRAFGRDVSATKLMRDDRSVRFLVVGSEGAGKVRGWLASGVEWGDVLTRLTAGTSA
jgi:hypothetical protein